MVGLPLGACARYDMAPALCNCRLPKRPGPLLNEELLKNSFRACEQGTRRSAQGANRIQPRAEPCASYLAGGLRGRQGCRQQSSSVCRSTARRHFLQVCSRLCCRLCRRLCRRLHCRRCCRRPVLCLPRPTLCMPPCTHPTLTHHVRSAAFAKAAVIGKGFLAGCIASCGAVAVTNPIDVVRTRLELQGELAKGGTQLYRGALHGEYGPVPW